MDLKQTANRTLLSTIGLLFCISPCGVHAEPSTASGASAPPAVGREAPDFELADLRGATVKLSALTKDGPAVLVMLRGYPGYQCPLCSAQVAQFLGRAKEFQRAKATVLLVYPGPADGLKKYAADFIGGQKLPSNFYLLPDPDYELTNAYHLRWNAPRETAYPATFLIDSEQTVRFAKVGKAHGDRASADEVLKLLRK